MAIFESIVGFSLLCSRVVMISPAIRLQHCMTFQRQNPLAPTVPATTKNNSGILQSIKYQQTTLNVTSAKSFNDVRMSIPANSNNLALGASQAE